MGYYRKKVRGNNYSIDQVISAPFGDDPVLISQATITNHGDDGRHRALAGVLGMPAVPVFLSCRHRVDDRDRHPDANPPRSWQTIQPSRVADRRHEGLLESKQFEGRSPQEEAAWARAKASLRANPNGFTAPVDGTETRHRIRKPQFAANVSGFARWPGERIQFRRRRILWRRWPVKSQRFKATSRQEKSKPARNTQAFCSSAPLRLAPQESRTVRFLYGYLPDGFTLECTHRKVREGCGLRIWPSHAGRGNRRACASTYPTEPWVKRESTWNHYYLRSSQTFDDFFGEHILNQNGFYQYTMGFQGAARDPLQHSLPFLFSDPEIVRSVMRYTLKEVRDDGSLPYGIVGTRRCRANGIRQCQRSSALVAVDRQRIRSRHARRRFPRRENSARVFRRPQAAPIPSAICSNAVIATRSTTSAWDSTASCA